MRKDCKMVELTPITILLGLAINGVFTGMGVAIGTWISNRHIVSRMEKINRDKLKGITKRFGEYVKGETVVNNYNGDAI
jgi:uncharacterized protein YneF (UPF0154 family)